MLILSNAFTEKPDEGCLKIASSLIKRIKDKMPQGSFVVTYERYAPLSDIHLRLNKLLLNPSLVSVIHKRRERVLYIPFSARTMPTAIRIFVLSLYARWGLDVLLVMKQEWGRLPLLLVRRSKANIFVVSRDVEQSYLPLFGRNRVHYLKMGVDTQKFVPVSKEKAGQLKVKYGLSPDRPVVLHVGHLQQGRNVGELRKIDPRYQVVLLTSTFNEENQDQALREQLMSCENIHLIDTYIAQIQEIYQMADVYFFPVVADSNCIDVPLSCLEAAACGIPVLTTAYGEMRELLRYPGFYPVASFEAEQLNRQIGRILMTDGESPRDAVLPYDWNAAAEQLRR